MNKKNIPLLLTGLCLMTACTTMHKDSQKTPPLEAIINGTFATDTAMQEERDEQGVYISEQEQRYE
jgi:hypothetical protein